jgi:uncharacterized protein YmfQ (DUF2313 family)
MTASLFSLDDYTAMLPTLFPRGRAWSTDPSSEQQQFIATLAPSFQRLDAAAQGLIVDGFPATAAQLLTEWEGSLGLPDPCVGEAATTAQRQAQVVLRLTDGGGQSAQHYISYAAQLGFEISIETFSPFMCGRNACGQPLYGPQWAFAWAVTVEASTQGFANSVLLCELEGKAPANTTVFLNT